MAEVGEAEGSDSRAVRTGKGDGERTKGHLEGYWI
jgi:hypothetical protein